MDRQTIGLDELVNAEPDLHDLVVQLVAPDEPTVVAVVDEGVTTGGLAIPVQGSANRPHLDEEPPVAPKVPVRSPQTSGRHLCGHGVQNEPHIDRAEFARMSVIQILHWTGDEPRPMEERFSLKPRPDTSEGDT